MQRAPAARAGLLRVGQAVLHRLDRQIFQLGRAVAWGFATADGDRLPRRLWDRRGFRFRLVEEERLLLRRGLFTGGAELPPLRQAKLLFQPLIFGG
jgi:hypothetical protein